MTRMLAPILLFILLFQPALTSADTWEGELDYDGERHGTWARSFDDANISETVTYWHGVQHGAYASFYPDGQKSAVSNFRDGLHHGDYTSFHNNDGNTQAAVGAHTDGKRSGDWTEWHPNGQIKSEVSYFNGEIHGMAEFFYASGSRNEIVEYRDGQRTGVYLSFHDNGDNTPKSEGALRNSRMFGQWTEWFPNGNVKSVMNYVSNVRHGPAQMRFENNQLHWESTYVSDQLHGLFVEYSANESHTKRFEGVYQYGKSTGIWSDWSPAGILVSEITYASDRMNGPATYYQAGDGSLRYTTVYMDDKEHGPYVSYHWPRPVTTFDPLASSEDNQEPTPYDQIEESGQHRNGQKVGEWTYTDIDGTVVTYTNWQNGVQHGRETRFYSNGDRTPEERGFWTDGWKTDEWTTWHDNAEMSSQGSYTRVGDETMTGSVRSGAWGYFNRDGELTRVVIYENDEVVSEQVNCDHEGVSCDYPQ